MRWNKLGLVFSPEGRIAWARDSALTPTPILIDDGTLRVYAGFRDERGRSRIGFVDTDPKEPTRVLRVSERPALDLGEPGAFDDHGVILGDVVRTADVLRMYYVGFHIPAHVKFLAYTGVAESADGGETYQRLTQGPVLGEAEEGSTIRALHTVRWEGGVWRAWYAIGSDWEILNGTPYPRYTIAYAESPDGICFPEVGRRCLKPVADEYRIGRPRVVRDDQGYHLLYTVGTRRRTYLPGYAVSADGISWERRDQEVGIAPSAQGWDSRHLSYLAPVQIGERVLAFYNGNDMGRSGFGAAELVSW